MKIRNEEIRLLLVTGKNKKPGVQVGLAKD
jgi:hypothetical protein